MSDLTTVVKSNNSGRTSNSVTSPFTEAEDLYFTAMLLVVGPYARLANGVAGYNKWWSAAGDYARGRNMMIDGVVLDANRIVNRFIHWFDEKRREAEYADYRNPFFDHLRWLSHMDEEKEKHDG